ncbi:MAG: hypothetical protein QHC79_25945 [Pseudosphingobacterium sp.]|nr:hypothetical protein [Pseudosphingobacterium sp.]
METISGNNIHAISIVGFLSKLGFQPHTKSGNEYHYHNLTISRQNGAAAASLSVNENLGVWYERKTGKSGSIVDLCCLFWNIGPDESVSRIRGLLSEDPSEIKRNKRPRIAVKVPSYTIERTELIGYNNQIAEYLKKTGIYDAATEYLREIYYYSTDFKGMKKHFSSAAMKNNSNGWVIVNKWYNGQIGKSDIIKIERDQEVLCVFENVQDFLSWIQYCRFEGHGSNHSAVVITDSQTLHKLVLFSASYKEIRLYFGNGHESIPLMNKIRDAVPRALRSGDYDNYRNFNHFWRTLIKEFVNLNG